VCFRDGCADLQVLFACFTLSSRLFFLVSAAHSNQLLPTLLQARMARYFRIVLHAVFEVIMSLASAAGFSCESAHRASCIRQDQFHPYAARVRHCAVVSYRCNLLFYVCAGRRWCVMFMLMCYCSQCCFLMGSCRPALVFFVSFRVGIPCVRTIQTL
jgi:hypothetical protein